MSISLINSILGYGRSLATSAHPRRHFIHIPKNGGLSVRSVLRGRVGTTPDYHWRYLDLYRGHRGDITYFASIRNPWSRTVSRYFYALKSAGAWSDDDPRKAYFTARLTFEQFVRDQRWFPIPEWPERPWMGPHGNWYNQLEWVRGPDGQVACDCLRLEHLKADLESYLRTKVDLPELNGASRVDYRRMYTDDTAEIVGTIYAADIETFGFTFDGAACKRIAVL